ncbi:MAG: hypothetical protein QOJ97_1341 [Solirubrobacteraceae bacterium]|jgi:hypothetical protein|nr:hypothetical protein [Solirubrobacteraceae bacterium]
MLAKSIATLPPAQRAAAAQVGSNDDALPGADGSVYLYGRTEHRVTRWLVDADGQVVDTASFHLRARDASAVAA